MNRRLLLLSPLMMLLACFMGCSERQPASPPDVMVSTENEPVAAASDVAPATPSQSVLYYFHHTVRCNECIAMELFSGEVLKSAFEAEVASGALEYRVVNLDDPGNEHYSADFNLSYSSLVLADQDAAGNVLRWKNLEEAWGKSRDQDVFKAYLKEMVGTWLNN